MKLLKMLVLLVLVFTIGWIPASAASTVYYIDGTNGLDSNVGTFASPWKTINKGVSKTAPGVTLVIRGGTYITSGRMPNFPVTATEAQPIILTNYVGEQVNTSDILLIVNIALGLTVAYLQLTCWKQIRKMSWAWIRMATGVVGFIWAGIYAVLLYQSIFALTTQLEFVQYTLGISRPAMTITLAILLSNVIISKRIR